MPNQYGQTPIDPRAELLIGRAYRPEPIQTGFGVLGRLAALGVGQHQQSQFAQQIADARLQYGQALQQAGGDQNARLAAITSGISSPDPVVRQSAAAEMARLTEQKTEILSTPGGGSAAVTMQGGRIVGQPQPLIEGRKAAPNIFEVKDGENTRTFAFDSNSGTMIDIATAPRETLQRILPPEVFQQQVALRTAQGEAEGAAAAKVAQVGAETTARAQATADVKRAEQQSAQVRYREQAASILSQIEGLLQQAGPGGALSPSLNDQIDGLRQAAAVAIARAQSESPEQEPNSDIVQGFKAMLPGSMKGAAGMTGGLDAAYALVGGRPAAAAAPPPAGMTPAQLRRMAELLEKAGQ